MIFTPPGFLGQYDSSFMQTTTQNLIFWCSEAVFPGLDLATQSIKPYGYGAIEKRPHMPQFGDCQIVVNSDAKAMNWTFFKKWMSMVINFDTSSGLGKTSREITDSTGSQNEILPYEIAYKDDIVQTVVITAYDDTSVPTLSITLNQAYPTSLGNIRFDWSQTDQIARFPVSFAYRDWFQNDTETIQSLGAATT